MSLTLEQDLKIRDFFEAGDVEKALEWVDREIKEAMDSVEVGFEAGRQDDLNESWDIGYNAAKAERSEELGKLEDKLKRIKDLL